MRLTLQETKEREDAVQAMIADGLTLREIANKLGVRVEAARRFMQLRGWETESMREAREVRVKSDRAKKRAAKRAEAKNAKS